MGLGLVHKLIQRFGLPPWLNGYRSLQSLAAEDFCRDYPDLGRFELLRDNEVMHFPLPRNVVDREMLNRSKGEHFLHSFYDVPELETGLAYAVHLKDCLLVRWTNEWSNDFYAVVSANRKNILVPGVGYSPGHGFFIHEKEIPSYRDGSFFLGMWYKNYYLWLTVYLSKMMFARDSHPEKPLILPEENRLSPINRYCLSLAGGDSTIVLSTDCNCWHFDELTLLYENPYRGYFLRKFRDMVQVRFLCGQPQRKIYVSRSNACYRHLKNEQEVQKLFLDHGWEIFQMEELSISDQIILMNETAAFASLHGAAFGNIVFCQEGTHVLEFSVRERPNANFYSLAACLGHHYWLEEALTCGENPQVIYDDAMVDCTRLEDTVKQLEAVL